MLSKLKTALLFVLGLVAAVFMYRSHRAESKLQQREIDDLKIEANAMEVVLDDKEAEQAIKDEPINRHSDLHRFE